MKSSKHILRNLLDSLFPSRYGKLKGQALKRSLLHLCGVILISAFLSGLIYFPQVVSFANSVSSSLEEFTEFSLDPEIETEAPITIWSDDLLVFDTTGNASMNDSRYFVDDEFLYYSYGQNRRELRHVGDVVENREFLSSAIIFISVLSLPSFLIAYVFVSSVVLISLIITASLLVWLLGKVFKSKNTFTNTLLSSIYASTVLGIALVFNSLWRGSGIYFVFIFLIYSIVGSMQKAKLHMAQAASDEDQDEIPVKKTKKKRAR